MKTLKLTTIFTLLFVSLGFAQTKFSVEFKVERQSMSTPMSPLDEVIFSNFYLAKPVNIKFDGSNLNMYFENGTALLKTNVTEVDREADYDDDNLIQEKILFTDNNNTADTISFVVNHIAGYVQVVLPTKNSKGDYIGYTSYRKTVKENELASR
jgi:hypothetical protein